MTINPYTLNQTMSVYYYAQMVLIYFPKGTDIRGAENTLTLSDTIKTSDGWIFWCQNVFPIAHGFDNEFLAAACAVAIAP